MTLCHPDNSVQDWEWHGEQGGSSSCSAKDKEWYDEHGGSSNSAKYEWWEDEDDAAGGSSSCSAKDEWYGGNGGHGVSSSCSAKDSEWYGGHGGQGGSSSSAKDDWYGGQEHEGGSSNPVKDEWYGGRGHGGSISSSAKDECWEDEDDAWNQLRTNVGAPKEDEMEPAQGSAKLKPAHGSATPKPVKGSVYRYMIVKPTSKYKLRPAHPSTPPPPPWATILATAKSMPNQPAQLQAQPEAQHAQPASPSAGTTRAQGITPGIAADILGDESMLQTVVDEMRCKAVEEHGHPGPQRFAKRERPRGTSSSGGRHVQKQRVIAVLKDIVSLRHT